MRKYLVLLAACISSFVSNAQNVGIGVPNPQNKLHVGGGFRLDTLTGVGGAGLVRHDANGVIYGIKFPGNANDVLRGDGTFGAFNVNGSIGWLLNGNSGTNASTHFLGTTDNVPFNIRVNNLRSGSIEITPGNTSWGYQSLLSNTDGARNTAIGNQALSKNTLGNDNTAVGYNALFQNIGAGNIVEPTPFRGVQNTAVGSNALSSNIAGSGNSAFGANAMSLSTSSQGSAFGAFALERNTSFNSSAFGYKTLTNNTSGNNNVGFGSFALYTNSTGNENTALGTLSLEKNTTGNNNTAVGSSAMENNIGASFNTSVGAFSMSANKTGYFNTGIGYKALEQNEGGWSNTGVGYEALKANKGGSNTAIGLQALATNTTGEENTAIGFAADVLSPDLFHAVAIGYGAKVGASQSLVLGGTGSNAVNVGIGVTVPISTLHVRGSAKIFAGGATHTGNFWNGTSNLSGVEITSSGNDAFIGIQRAGTSAALHISKPFGSIGDQIAFFNSSVLVGRIYSDGTSVAYLTTSDFRLKENRTASQFSLETLMQIKAEDYNYISDNKKILQTGFIAQDLYKIFPQAVVPGGDDPKTDPWMIDYSKLTPLLVKAVQEQQKIIDDQNKKIYKQQQQIDLLIQELQSLKKDFVTQKN